MNLFGALGKGLSEAWRKRPRRPWPRPCQGCLPGKTALLTTPFSPPGKLLPPLLTPISSSLSGPAPARLPLSLATVPESSLLSPLVSFFPRSLPLHPREGQSSQSETQGPATPPVNQPGPLCLSPSLLWWHSPWPPPREFHQAPA